MSGRISVDLLPLVKREYKLPKYNLDTVANHFLKTGKDPVTAQDMFKIVKCMLMLEDVIEHLNPDERNMYGLTKDERDAILYRIRNADALIKWAIQQNKDRQTLTVEQLNQLIDLINYVNEQIKVVADYCIKDSIVVMDLFDKLNIWIYLIQLSTITGVTPMELFTRGQQARGLSVVYNLAAKTGYVLDSKVYPKDSFAGGFVWDPVPGVYDFVICLDFKSLYPNIIRAFNICWTTFVPAWLDHRIKDEDCNVIEWDDKVELEPGERCDNIVKNNDNKDCKLVHRRFRFVKPHIKQGMLPDLVAYLIDERNKVRKQQKQFEEGSVEWIICEQRQLGLKQTGNSMYGLLGVTGEGGVLPLPEAAAAVTAYGRQLITFANDYIVKKYDGKVIYNDTDSTMVQIPGIDNGLDANAWGLKLEHELSALPEFPDPLYLEFEKAGRQFCIAKKNYVYWIYDKNGEYPRDKDGRPLFMSRGIPLARRDKAGWQRDIVAEALYTIIERKEHQVFLDMVVERVIKTLRQEMPWRDFIIIRGLGAGYKDKTYFMKVFAEELQKLGRPAQPGDRLEYVVVKPKKPQSLLGRCMRDPETYYRRLGTQQHEPIDYEYYIEHFLMECIEKYWRIAYKDVVEASMEHNRIMDYSKVLQDVRFAGYDTQVAQALTVNNYDPERAVKALLLTPLKNKVITARRAYITGRHIFDCRLNDKPIKTLMKGYRLGRLEEAVKSLASPEMYAKLYPGSA
jgi:DNA polymerase elongation subunit (family B)